MPWIEVCRFISYIRGREERESSLVFFLSLPFTAERHGPAGQGYCQGGFSADFTKVRATFTISAWFLESTPFISPLQHLLELKVKFMTAQLLRSGYCFMFQDGKVVLGGPGSFYWQGELAGMCYSMDFQEISWNGFFFPRRGRESDNRFISAVSEWRCSGDAVQGSQLLF